MTIWGRIKSTFAGPKASALNYGPAAYDAARYDLPNQNGWQPQINAVDDETSVGRDIMVGRIRDLVRNNPVIAGGIDRLCESVIGPKMWPEFEPAYAAIGRTVDWSFDFAMKAESKYSVWANDPLRRCDVHRKSRIPELIRTGYRHWLVDGEACAVIKMIKGRGKYRTCVELIDPDRLSTPDGMAEGEVMPNGNRMRHGIEIAPDGDPVAYHIRKRHPKATSTDPDMFSWVRIPRYAKSGRQVFIHAFRQDRADQRRGVSRIASAMAKIKMADRYSNAELAAALFDALNVGFIQSDNPTADVRDAMQAPSGSEASASYEEKRLEYRKQNKVQVEGINFWHLFTGEKANFNKPARPNGNYPDFMADHQRNIAVAMGTAYPYLSGNWADINYSSGRLMQNEIWRGYMEDRELFTQEFATPIAAAWMEEAALIGEIKIPGGAFNFYKYTSELTMVSWRGPGPGYGDPKKEAEAAEIDLRGNFGTHDEVAAMKGTSAIKLFERRAFHRKMQKDMGLIDIADTENLMGPGRPTEGSTSAEGVDGRDGEGPFAPSGPAKKKKGAEE